MGNSRLVLVGVAVLVEVPDDDNLMYDRMETVGRALQKLARQVAAEQPGCSATDVTSYHYPGDEFENGTRCARCGAWASDFKKPNCIDGIRLGSIVDDQFFCTQCYNHKPNRSSN